MFQEWKTKFALGANKFLPARLAQRLARREDGAAAVEFALVAAPFLALLFAIIETSLIFFAGQTLETATADASRLVMTGQAQAQGFTMTEFKNAVCARIYAMFDCAGKIQIDVRTAVSFSSTNTSKPIKDGKLDTTGFGYQPGGPNCIVVARVMYEWPVYVSLLGLNLADLSTGKRLLMATAAFRNEPYGAPAC
jgi:Flp pilus assembly protein TadG